MQTVVRLHHARVDAAVWDHVAAALPPGVLTQDQPGYRPDTSSRGEMREVDVWPGPISCIKATLSVLICRRLGVLPPQNR
jgi:hypothetical protein